MKQRLLVLFLTLSLSGILMASGFNINEFGGRASALGGAVVARTMDPSTLYYNPAGLAFLEGTSFYGGATLILPRSRFVGAAPVFDNTVHALNNDAFLPVGVYFSHKFSKKFGAGISLTNPFGLGVKWKKNFPGREISRNAQLQSFYISPVLAYEIAPGLSIGGGVDLVISHVELERYLSIFNSQGSTGTEVGKVKMTSTSDLAAGFSVGLQYRAPRFGFGAMYRNSVKNKFNGGTADFTIFDNISVPNAAALARSLLKDQSVSTRITFPNFFSVGAYVSPVEKLGIEVDYMYFHWQKFKSLSLTFDNSALNQTLDFNYNNSYQIRVGVEYALTTQLQARAGYIYDQTPQPIESVNPVLPDADRNDFSFGLGYTSGNLQFDAGYMVVDLKTRSTVENGIGKNPQGFNGTYNSLAQLIFFSFGINWK